MMLINVLLVSNGNTCDHTAVLDQNGCCKNLLTVTNKTKIVNVKGTVRIFIIVKLVIIHSKLCGSSFFII